MEKKKERVRALAFSTGGIDAVMQLGVAHAMLVARAVPPDYVVGVSAGAINAVALAEILQAGEDLDDVTPRERLAIKTDRLREYINAYMEVPRALADAIIPDSLEVTSKQPLKPLDSPLHFAEERATRERANEAKAGLISLINDVFQIRLPFSAVTGIVRRLLGCVQAGELPTWWRRVSTELREEAGLIATVWHRLPHVAPMVCSIAWAALWGDNLARFRRRGARTTTAGSLVSQWRRFRNAVLALKMVAQVAIVAPVLAFLTAVWFLLWAPFCVPLRRLVRSRALPGRAPAADFFDRVLAYYGLCDSVAATDIIKQQIIQCFDQKYYGETPIVPVLQRALDYSNGLNETRHDARRRLRDYVRKRPSIKVGVVAANVATGELEVLPPQVPVVDALCAAVAVVPFLPPVGIDLQQEADRAGIPFDGSAGMRWYIDGANISAQAIGPLMDMLRDDLATKEEKELPAIVDVYPVNTLPISRGEWREDQTGAGLIYTALRALRLKALRDATMERRLTSFYTAALPHGKALHYIDGVHYVRANVFPIELDKPPEVNTLLALKPEDLRTAVYQTAAKGCLAALEQLMPRRFAEAAAFPTAQPEPPSGKPAAGNVSPQTQSFTPAPPAALPEASPEALQYPANAHSAVFCRLAVQHRLGVTKDRDARLPGGKRAFETIDAPGLPEICRHCTLNFVPVSGKTTEEQRKEWVGGMIERMPAMRSKSMMEPPEWPVDETLVTANTTYPITIENLVVAAADHKTAESEREKVDKGPLISMLFGGGVFRGVFHVGVLNALNEMHVQPDVVAGASVGSIIAAMIARVLTDEDRGRPLRIARLAATFLAIDKLILTDRLADAVRRLTLRGGQTHFSLYDLDRVFRRYEVGSAEGFAARARKIAAGVERLFYISPFELKTLAQAYREDDLQTVKHDLLEDAADFLFRSGIGDEILGSEPLRILIEHHVIHGLNDHIDIRDVPLNDFKSKEHQLSFFATVTNMTRGKLELLRSDAGRKHKASLLFSLLSSSAFPAVFRPRSSWEVYREPRDLEQFIDGGVIDNLPLDSVTEYLDSVLSNRWRRPKVTIDSNPEEVPHLLFTASLEVDKTCMPLGGWDLEQTRRSWRRLRARAKTFTYNRKVDAYARVQRDIRRIHREHPTGPKKKAPLDLHVLAVKPRWLCGTFGFHPMLGFKRWKQAASIAHGCASTFGAMVATNEAHPMWIRGWRVKGLDDINRSAVVITRDGATSGASREKDYQEYRYELRPQRAAKGDGRGNGTCWFRNTARCPFSAEALERVEWLDEKERDAMMRELPKIYEACGMERNHEGTRGAGK
jgi:predicted acylesterase/phospholipase RssA